MSDVKSFKQARKDGDISGADDLFKIPLSSIQVEQGFNERHDRPELREHIAGMVGFLRNGGKLPPLVLDQQFQIRDGHCRYAAYQELVSAGELAADQIIQFLPFRGTPLNALLTIVTSNNGLKLTPLESARVYARAKAMILKEAADNGYPAPSALDISNRIAAEAGCSRAKVDQGLILAGAGDEVHAQINGGKISATEAVKVARDHGANAAAEIERREKVAIAAGKKKVTAAAKPPSRPKVDFVTSCAVVLVNHCQQDVHLMEALENTNKHLRVSVDADLLNDLISAVREMRQGNKPVVLDGQLALESL